MKKIILVFMLIVVFQVAKATTYYVSHAGSDANNGLTPETSWLSIGKIGSFSFTSGDVVCLKKGEIWYQGLTNLSNGVTITSYGNGEKPEIRAWGKLPNWDTSGNWTQYVAGVWRISSGNFGGRLWINGKERKEAKTTTLTTEYCWHFDGSYLYIKSATNPATTFNSIEFSTAHIYDVFDLTSVNNITIDGISFSGGRYILKFLNSHDITIKNCKIGNKGTHGIWSYTSAGNSCYNITVHDNIFTTGDSLKYNYFRVNGTTRTILATGDACTIQGTGTDCQVYNNYFNNWSHVGVYFLGVMNNCDAYKNFFEAPFVDYGRGICVDISSGVGNSIHDNVIRNTTIQNQLNANGDFKFYNNIIDNVAGGTYTEITDKGYGISSESYANPSYNMEIYNNSIFNCANGGIKLYNSDPNPYKTHDNNIHDNNIFNCGSTYPAQLTTFNTTSTYNNIFSNNHLYHINSAYVVTYKGSGRTLTEFNDITPTNGDVISGNDGIINYSIPITSGFITQCQDLYFYHNYNQSTTKSIAIADHLVDAAGTPVNASIDISGLSSIILMFDPNYRAPIKYHFQNAGGGKYQYNKGGIILRPN